MVRSFDGSEIDASLVTDIFEQSLRAPTAGNARGISWLVLIGADETDLYFESTTDREWRSRSQRYEGLRRASAVGLCLADPLAYVERYRQDDKIASGLGESPDAWPIPYWIGDAGAACLAALLLVESERLAGCFLGAFRGAPALRRMLSIPEHLVLYGAVLVGIEDGNDHRSSSLDQPGPKRSARVHRRTFTQR